MQKKLLFSGLVFSLFASLMIPKNELSLKAKESSNGYHVEEVIRDKFNKETVDSSWKLNGATQEHYYNALHCISPLVYGSGPYISGAKLANKTRIEFSIYPQMVSSGANISFNIGMPSNGLAQTEPNVDCKIQLWDTSATFVDYQHNLQLAEPITIASQVFSAVNLYDAATDVAIQIERESDRTTKLFVEYKRDGKVVSTSESTPFTLNDPRYADGFCGFFWDCLEMDLTNFKVYNNDELVMDDSFETNTISFTTQMSDDINFNVYGLNETNCYYANVNSIKMDEANDSIINSYELKEQENVSNPYEASYNIKVNELNDNSFVGFGFGLDANDTKIDATNAIGFIKSDENNVEVVAIKNGEVDRSNNYTMGISKLGIGRSQNYSVSFDYAHHAYLTVNGLTFKFDNFDYVGRLGLGLVDLGATKASNIELNEFILMSNTYKKYSTMDYSNDFGGTVLAPDSTDDYEIYNPYLNTQKYFVGPSVSLEEDWVTGKASISFAGTTPYSGFGVREKYSEFICEFDFEVVSRQNFQYIGLSFGRESVVDLLTQASVSNKAFLFRCDNNGESTANCVWGSGLKFDNGTDSFASSINIFDPEHTKYHIMFVARNRGLYVYYKEYDAPDAEMGILRAYIPNINIDGYVSIVGNNGAAFDVTNFKMVNLSDECKEESNLTIRETFEGKNIVSEKLALDGVSKVKDGRLVMNNSSIQTVNPYLYDIIRFTTYDLDDSMQIFFSQGKKVTIDAKNNQIIVTENGIKTKYDCGVANLKNIKGKRFELTIMGNQIKVSYKGYYDPQDKLAAELMSHTFLTPLTKDNITFSSNGKIVLDDFYLFALDNSMRCGTYNYDDDPDNANIWIPKKDFDPTKVYKPDTNDTKENKGCNGSASASLLLVLALPLLFKRKKED